MTECVVVETKREGEKEGREREGERGGRREYI
jgi:hypothetical protein